MEKKRDVVLPIDISDADCVTECWTNFRLMIIKTSPYYVDWIASHYNIYADKDMNFYFGETNLSQPSTYDTILLRKAVYLYKLSENNIIEAIKTELLSDNYILMYIKGDSEKYHEVLFYGFCESDQEFLMAGLKDGVFQKLKISYMYIKNQLADVQKCFLKDAKGIRNIFMNYQYLITAFRLNESYSARNCPYEAYTKIHNELYGGCHRIFGFSDFGKHEEWRAVYRGINCLYALKKMLQKEISGECFFGEFRGMVNGVKKVQEHQRMLIVSMEYLLMKWKQSVNELAKKCVDEYKQCYKIVEMWLSMVLKYQYTNDKELLRRIVTQIPDIYHREQRVLEEFVNDGITWKTFVEEYM